ncbi:MAG: PrsW family intramembrane metalloprotease [Polyangiaceae bacterium]|nr:PrsW family intramembrane metalloprotease [Polyangiaceae bacterium]
MPAVAVSLLLGAVPLVVPLLLWRTAALPRSVRLRWLLLQMSGGAIVSAFVIYMHRVAMALFGWSHDVLGRGQRLEGFQGVLLGTLVSQTLLLLVVLPLQRRRLLRGRPDGFLCATSAAAGLCAVQTVVFVQGGAIDALTVVRALFSVPASLFSAGLWGYFLGSQGPGSWKTVPPAWLSGLALQAVYDHLLFERGPGFAVALLPLLAVVVVGSRAIIRELGHHAVSHTAAHAHLLGVLPEAPSLSDLGEALRPAGHGVKIRWVVAGVFVLVGVTLSGLVLAVVLGNRLGIDFARANEADFRANSPLLLLGSAGLVGFYIAGYLVTRASGSETVIEAALSAGLCLLGAFILVSMAEPLAAVFVLAVSPVAFALACTGAWWAARRERPGAR